MISLIRNFILYEAIPSIKDTKLFDKIQNARIKIKNLEYEKATTLYNYIKAEEGIPNEVIAEIECAMGIISSIHFGRNDLAKKHFLNASNYIYNTEGDCLVKINLYSLYLHEGNLEDATPIKEKIKLMIKNTEKDISSEIKTIIKNIEDSSSPTLLIRQIYKNKEEQASFPEKNRAKAINFLRNNDIISAISIFMDILGWAKNNFDKELEILTLIDLGVSFFELRNLEDSYNSYKSAIKLSQETGNKKLLSSVLNNLAILEKEKGNLQQSISLYKKSISIKEEIGENPTSNLYYNLANVLTEANLFEEGRIYIEEAIKIDTLNNDQEYLKKDNDLLKLINQRHTSQ